jgi:PAS domain-containing protein
MYALWCAEPGSFQPTVDDLLSYIHPEDRHRMGRIIVGGAETDGSGADFRATAGDGRLRWFRGRASAERAPDGRPVRVVGTIQDITREKETEEQLRASVARYRQMLESAGVTDDRCPRSSDGG